MSDFMPPDGAGEDPWAHPKIANDKRIAAHDPAVRRIAERLHANESMHCHEWISAKVCVYCALRVSRVLSLYIQIEADVEPLLIDSRYGLIKTPMEDPLEPPAMASDPVMQAQAGLYTQPVNHLQAGHEHVEQTGHRLALRSAAASNCAECDWASASEEGC